MKTDVSPTDEPLIPKEVLSALRYKCSCKMRVVLCLGIGWFLLLAWMYCRKMIRTSETNPVLWILICLGVFLLISGICAMTLHRMQTLNFLRFLQGCAVFEKMEYNLEYVELRMPTAFSPRFLQVPVHLLILGNVLTNSEKKENVKTGNLMVETACRYDDALEAFRSAPLSDLMKYYNDVYAAAHPEVTQNWKKAEKFHSFVLHFLLPLSLIVTILSAILRGCNPPAE